MRQQVDQHHPAADRVRQDGPVVHADGAGRSDSAAEGGQLRAVLLAHLALLRPGDQSIIVWQRPHTDGRVYSGVE